MGGGATLPWAAGPAMLGGLSAAWLCGALVLLATLCSPSSFPSSFLPDFSSLCPARVGRKERKGAQMR